MTDLSRWRLSDEQWSALERLAEGPVTEAEGDDKAVLDYLRALALALDRYGFLAATRYAITPAGRVLLAERERWRTEGRASQVGSTGDYPTDEERRGWWREAGGAATRGLDEFTCKVVDWARANPPPTLSPEECAAVVCALGRDERAARTLGEETAANRAAALAAKIRAGAQPPAPEVLTPEECATAAAGLVAYAKHERRYQSEHYQQHADDIEAIASKLRAGAQPPAPEVLTPEECETLADLAVFDAEKMLETYADKDVATREHGRLRAIAAKLARGAQPAQPEAMIDGGDGEGSCLVCGEEQEGYPCMHTGPEVRAALRYAQGPCAYCGSDSGAQPAPVPGLTPEWRDRVSDLLDWAQVGRMPEHADSVAEAQRAAAFVRSLPTEPPVVSEPDNHHALTWPAWRGLLETADSTYEDWLGAKEAGLVGWQTPNGATYTSASSRLRSATPKGRRYLAMAREAAAGLTAEDVRLMRHATSTPGRNHFSADAGTEDNGAWSRLVMVGLAKRTREDSGSGRRVYLVTNKGRAALYLYEQGDDRHAK